MAAIARKWIESEVDLPHSVSNVQRDCSNGFLLAEVLAKRKFITEEEFGNVKDLRSTTVILSNFGIVAAGCKRLGVPLSRRTVSNIVCEHVGAAADLLLQMRDRMDELAGHRRHGHHRTKNKTRKSTRHGRESTAGSLASSLGGDMPGTATSTQSRVRTAYTAVSFEDDFAEQMGKIPLANFNARDMAMHLQRFVRTAHDQQVNARMLNAQDAEAEWERIAHRRELTLSRARERSQFMREWEAEGRQNWTANQRVARERIVRDERFQQELEHKADARDRQERAEHENDEREGVNWFEENMKRLGVSSEADTGEELRVTYESSENFVERLHATVKAQEAAYQMESADLMAAIKQRSQALQASRYERERRQRSVMNAQRQEQERMAITMDRERLQASIRQKATAERQEAMAVFLKLQEKEARDRARAHATRELRAKQLEEMEEAVRKTTDEFANDPELLEAQFRELHKVHKQARRRKREKHIRALYMCREMAGHLIDLSLCALTLREEHAPELVPPTVWNNTKQAFIKRGKLIERKDPPITAFSDMVREARSVHALQQRQAAGNMWALPPLRTEDEQANAAADTAALQTLDHVEATLDPAQTVHHLVEELAKQREIDRAMPPRALRSLPYCALTDQVRESSQTWTRFSLFAVLADAPASVAPLYSTLIPLLKSTCADAVGTASSAAQKRGLETLVIDPGEVLGALLHTHSRAVQDLLKQEDAAEQLIAEDDVAAVVDEGDASNENADGEEKDALQAFVDAAGEDSDPRTAEILHGTEDFPEPTCPRAENVASIETREKAIGKLLAKFVHGVDADSMADIMREDEDSPIAPAAGVADEESKGASGKDNEETPEQDAGDAALADADRWNCPKHVADNIVAEAVALRIRHAIASRGLPPAHAIDEWRRQRVHWRRAMIAEEARRAEEAEAAAAKSGDNDEASVKQRADALTDRQRAWRSMKPEDHWATAWGAYPTVLLVGFPRTERQARLLEVHLRGGPERVEFTTPVDLEEAAATWLEDADTASVSMDTALAAASERIVLAAGGKPGKGGKGVQGKDKGKGKGKGKSDGKGKKKGGLDFEEYAPGAFPCSLDAVLLASCPQDAALVSGAHLVQRRAEDGMDESLAEGSSAFIPASVTEGDAVGELAAERGPPQEDQLQNNSSLLLSSSIGNALDPVSQRRLQRILVASCAPPEDPAVGAEPPASEESGADARADEKEDGAVLTDEKKEGVEDRPEAVGESGVSTFVPLAARLPEAVHVNGRQTVGIVSSSSPSSTGATKGESGETPAIAAQHTDLAKWMSCCQGVASGPRVSLALSEQSNDNGGNLNSLCEGLLLLCRIVQGTKQQAADQAFETCFEADGGSKAPESSKIAEEEGGEELSAEAASEHCRALAALNAESRVLKATREHWDQELAQLHASIPVAARLDVQLRTGAISLSEDAFDSVHEQLKRIVVAPASILPPDAPPSADGVAEETRQPSAGEISHHCLSHICQQLEGCGDGLIGFLDKCFQVIRADDSRWDHAIMRSERLFEALAARVMDHDIEEEEERYRNRFKRPAEGETRSTPAGQPATTAGTRDMRATPLTRQSSQGSSTVMRGVAGSYPTTYPQLQSDLDRICGDATLFLGDVADSRHKELLRVLSNAFAELDGWEADVVDAMTHELCRMLHADLELFDDTAVALQLLRSRLGASALAELMGEGLTHKAGDGQVPTRKTLRRQTRIRIAQAYDVVRSIDASAVPLVSEAQQNSPLSGGAPPTQDSAVSWDDAGDAPVEESFSRQSHFGPETNTDDGCEGEQAEEEFVDGGREADQQPPVKAVLARQAVLALQKVEDVFARRLQDDAVRSVEMELTQLSLTRRVLSTLAMYNTMTMRVQSLVALSKQCLRNAVEYRTKAEHAAVVAWTSQLAENVERVDSARNILSLVETGQLAFSLQEDNLASRRTAALDFSDAHLHTGRVTKLHQQLRSAVHGGTSNVMRLDVARSTIHETAKKSEWPAMWLDSDWVDRWLAQFSVGASRETVHWRRAVATLAMGSLPSVPSLEYLLSLVLRVLFDMMTKDLAPLPGELASASVGKDAGQTSASRAPVDASTEPDALRVDGVEPYAPWFDLQSTSVPLDHMLKCTTPWWSGSDNNSDGVDAGAGGGVAGAVGGLGVSTSRVGSGGIGSVEGLGPAMESSSSIARSRASSSHVSGKQSNRDLVRASSTSLSRGKGSVAEDFSTEEGAGAEMDGMGAAASPEQEQERALQLIVSSFADASGRVNLLDFLVFMSAMPARQEGIGQYVADIGASAPGFNPGLFRAWTVTAWMRKWLSRLWWEHKSPEAVAIVTAATNAQLRSQMSSAASMASLDDGSINSAGDADAKDGTKAEAGTGDEKAADVDDHGDEKDKEAGDETQGEEGSAEEKSAKTSVDATDDKPPGSAKVLQHSASVASTTTAQMVKAEDDPVTDPVERYIAHCDLLRPIPPKLMSREWLFPDARVGPPLFAHDFAALEACIVGKARSSAAPSGPHTARTAGSAATPAEALAADGSLVDLPSTSISRSGSAPHAAAAGSVIASTSLASGAGNGMTHIDLTAGLNRSKPSCAVAWLEMCSMQPRGGLANAKALVHANMRRMFQQRVSSHVLQGAANEEANIEQLATNVL